MFEYLDKVETSIDGCKSDCELISGSLNPNPGQVVAVPDTVGFSVQNVFYSRDVAG